jgi:hypothetical protein
MAIGGLDSDPTDHLAAIEMHRQEPNSPIAQFQHGAMDMDMDMDMDCFVT